MTPIAAEQSSRKTGRPGGSVVTATTACRLKSAEWAGQRDDGPSRNRSSNGLLLFVSQHRKMKLYLCSRESQVLFYRAGRTVTPARILTRGAKRDAAHARGAKNSTTAAARRLKHQIKSRLIHERRSTARPIKSYTIQATRPETAR